MSMESLWKMRLGFLADRSWFTGGSTDSGLSAEGCVEARPLKTSLGGLSFDPFGWKEEEEQKETVMWAHDAHFLTRTMVAITPPHVFRSWALLQTLTMILANLTNNERNAK